MTKTQVSLATTKLKTSLKTPSPDCRLPLAPTPKTKSKNSRKLKHPVTPVLPAELLLDVYGTVAVAVGDRAVPIAAVGTMEEWPLPTELLLLLEPGQQPEVLAEVGLEDQ